MSFSNFYYRDTPHHLPRIEDNIEFAERILLDIGLIILKLDNSEIWPQLNITTNNLFKNKNELKLLNDHEIDIYYNLLQKVDSQVQRLNPQENLTHTDLALQDCNEIIKSDATKKLFINLLHTELSEVTLTKIERTQLNQIIQGLNQNCDLKAIRNLLPQFDMLLNKYPDFKKIFAKTLKEYFLPLYFMVDNVLLQQESMRRALFI